MFLYEIIPKNCAKISVFMGGNNYLACAGVELKKYTLGATRKKEKKFLGGQNENR